MNATRRTITTIAATAALALVACGSDDEPPIEETPPAETSPSPDEPGDGDEGVTEPPAGEEDPDGSDGLPGSETELGPTADDQLITVGVGHDDVLHVRDAPGADAQPIGEIPPVATGITATGSNRELDDGSIWAQIHYGDTGDTGWAAWQYLGYIADTDDITDEFPADWTGETVWELAEQVLAERYEGAEDAGELDIVLISDEVDDPEASDALIDVLGFADDSVRGERLRVEATDADGHYTIEQVVVNTLCWRGVSDGQCV